MARLIDSPLYRKNLSTTAKDRNRQRFTGIAANGHRYVNGVQVAIGDDTPSKPKSGRKLAGTTPKAVATKATGILSATGDKIKAMATALGEKYEALKGQAFASLHPRAQEGITKLLAVAHTLEKPLEKFYHAGQKAATEVARGYGLNDEQVKTLGKVLGTADAVARWTANVPILHEALHVVAHVGGYSGFLGAKAGFYMPIASMTFVATAGTGLAAFNTIKAARETIRGVLKRKGKTKSMKSTSAEMLAEAMKAANFDQRYYALIMAALDETGDLAEAIEAANEAFETDRVEKTLKTLRSSPLYALITKGLTKSADDLGDERERIEAIADIIGGLYGDKALSMLDGAGDDVAKTLRRSPLYVTKAGKWDEVAHPRGKGGRFIPKGSAEAVASAKDAIKQTLKQPKTAETAKKLVEHLSILTVKQLHELKKEYKLSASGDLKEKLIAKLADRLGKGREDVPDGEDKPYKDWAKGERESRKKPAEEKVSTKKPKKTSEHLESLASVIKKNGGISRASLGETWNISEDFAQNGLLNVFAKKGGVGLDDMADQLEAAGHIKVPSNRNADDYLMELLQSKAKSLHSDYTSEIEREQKAYYEDLKNAEQYADQSEIDAAVRASEEAGRTKGEGWEIGEDAGDVADEKGGGEVGGFEFGANVGEENAQPGRHLFAMAGHQFESLQSSLGIKKPAIGDAGLNAIQSALAKRTGGKAIDAILSVHQYGYDDDGYPLAPGDALRRVLDGKFTSDELLDAAKWASMSDTRDGPDRFLYGAIQTSKTSDGVTPPREAFAYMQRAAKMEKFAASASKDAKAEVLAKAKSDEQRAYQIARGDSAPSPKSIPSPFANKSEKIPPSTLDNRESERKIPSESETKPTTKDGEKMNATTETKKPSRSEVASKIKDKIDAVGDDYSGKVVSLKDGRTAIFLKVRHPNPRRGVEEKGTVFINRDGSVELDKDFAFHFRVGDDGKNLLDEIRSMSALPADPLPQVNRPQNDSQSSDDPMERLEWLANRQQGRSESERFG